MSTHKKKDFDDEIDCDKLPFRVILGPPNQEAHTFKHNQLQCFSFRSTRGTAPRRCLLGECFEADLNDNNLVSCL